MTGRWEWGSGSQHCSWLLGGALVTDDDGAPVTGPSGLPTARLCFAPAEQVEIVPNWDVLGMRGTGSHDLVMDRVAVPARHTVSLVDDRPWADGALYRFPPFGLLALGIAAVSLGVGRAALDAVVDLTASKVPMGSARTLSTRSTVRAELARGEAALRAARAYLFGEVDAVWARAEAGADLLRGGSATADRAALRLAATHVTEAVADLTARLHRLAGGTAVREGQVIERCFRDAHVATQHVLVNANLYPTVGTVLLGGEPGVRGAVTGPDRPRITSGADAAAWLADHPAPSGADLAGAGLVAPHWPAPWGLGPTPPTSRSIDEELLAAGVTLPDNPIGIGWAGPTILAARHGGAAATGTCPGSSTASEIWCQLFSEPDAGSRPGVARAPGPSATATSGW